MNMPDDVETQGFRKVVCPIEAPMHFQLLESDSLLELLLLEELFLFLLLFLSSPFFLPRQAARAPLPPALADGHYSVTTGPRS